MRKDHLTGGEMKWIALGSSCQLAAGLPLWLWSPGKEPEKLLHTSTFQPQSPPSKWHLPSTTHIKCHEWDSESGHHKPGSIYAREQVISLAGSQCLHMLKKKKKRSQLAHHWRTLMLWKSSCLERQMGCRFHSVWLVFLYASWLCMAILPGWTTQLSTSNTLTLLQRGLDSA